MEGRAGFFNRVAELYDQYRPSYPVEAIQFLLSRSQATGPVLEIGSGTGLFTERLVDAGCSVTCVEPGASLIEVARRKFGRQVNIVESAWRPSLFSEPTFSACFSAQAFHWVGPQGFPAVAHALLPGAVFALVWNSDRTDTGDLTHLFDPIWSKYHPGDRVPDAPSSREECRDALASSTLFTEFREDSFAWSQSYTSDEYARLLSTYSDVGSLPEAEKLAFMAEVTAAVDSVGGQLVKPYVCRCFSALVNS